jgi:hypothetical protein
MSPHLPTLSHTNQFHAFLSYLLRIKLTLFCCQHPDVWGDLSVSVSNTKAQEAFISSPKRPTSSVISTPFILSPQLYLMNSTTMKLFNIQFSPSCSYWLPFRSKYVLQHPMLVYVTGSQVLLVIMKLKLHTHKHERVIHLALWHTNVLQCVFIKRPNFRYKYFIAHCTSF